MAETAPTTERHAPAVPVDGVPATDGCELSPRAHPSPVGAAALVAAELVTAFGVVVGFNQLATQSPVDAVLPVALLSVGAGGILTLLAAIVGGRHDDGAGGTLGTSLVSPPTLDAGFAAFALGLVALFAVFGRWGVAAQAALVGAQGLRLVLQAQEGAALTARRCPVKPDPFRLALVAAEGVILVIFAVAALSDGGVQPFG